MAQCSYPYAVKNSMRTATIPVPCGKCYDCKQRRSSQWSFRLMQQEKIAVSAQFLTLTYDTSHVPITRNGFMGLRRTDIQLFFKRLRKAHTSHGYYNKRLQNGSTRPRIKYFSVGEYGETYKRPHYHIICFNADIKLIDPAWGLGSIHYGDVSGASVGYTLKYITKEGWQPQHSNDDREPPKYNMSKNLGLNYLSDAMVRYHRATPDNFYCTTDDKQKIAIPRYYKDKIWPSKIIDEDLGITVPDRQRTVYGIINRNKKIQKDLERERSMSMPEFAQYQMDCDESLKAKQRFLKLKLKLDKL